MPEQPGISSQSIIEYLQRLQPPQVETATTKIQQKNPVYIEKNPISYSIALTIQTLIFQTLLNLFYFFCVFQLHYPLYRRVSMSLHVTSYLCKGRLE